ncbi:DUF983 domain-containing protein [Hymenobacter crusticola]|uniref:DUF983 domain-containing protein n=1 Tax=Hymenobacter crusticola TaxID=1770526 RepID=A0A243W9A2_9BACT|nr:DUF983 domain-containing protein [Hymenobacter crusticola]OUJ71967.1 hypothetical protein BXP70_20345 [Hymenobacter crusticola]
MKPIESSTLAMLDQRCPRCHQGPLFTHSAFNLAHFTDMPERCPVCGLVYEIEPGFYWGAMYISFAFGTGIMLVVGVLLFYLAGDPATWVYVTCVSIGVLLTCTLSLRYSRTIMLYLFGGVRYNPEWASAPTRRSVPE